MFYSHHLYHHKNTFISQMKNMSNQAPDCHKPLPLVTNLFSASLGQIMINYLKIISSLRWGTLGTQLYLGETEDFREQMDACDMSFPQQHGTENGSRIYNRLLPRPSERPHPGDSQGSVTRASPTGKGLANNYRTESHILKTTRAHFKCHFFRMSLDQVSLIHTQHHGTS